MTDTEYMETACNAFAMGVLPMPKEWATMPPATRLARAKGLHAELLKSDKPAVVAFRKQNQRLFRTSQEPPRRPGMILPFGAEIKRHLIYHVGPFAGNGTWQSNVEQLRRRMALFNGKRVVAIITGDRLDNPDQVKRAFGSDVSEFIVMRNNPGLREVATFYSLLDRVCSTGPNEVTFFAHAKGVTKSPSEKTTCHRWAEIQYETCLDYWPLVEKLLVANPMAGSFKRVGPAFDGCSRAAWHYSGTFYWFRNCDVFARKWWEIDQAWFGAESWPGLQFAAHESATIFMQGGAELNLYDAGYFGGVVEPQYQLWKSLHAKERSVLSAM